MRRTSRWQRSARLRWLQREPSMKVSPPGGGGLHVAPPVAVEVDEECNSAGKQCLCAAPQECAACRSRLPKVPTSTPVMQVSAVGSPRSALELWIPDPPQTTPTIAKKKGERKKGKRKKEKGDKCVTPGIEPKTLRMY